MNNHLVPYGFIDAASEKRCDMEEERIVSDGGSNTIGRNIRWIRKSLKIRQTEMVARLQLYRVSITREALVKIESGRQHIKLSQLRGLREVLGVSYEDILDQPGDALVMEIERREKEEQEKKEKKKKRRGRKRIKPEE